MLCKSSKSTVLLTVIFCMLHLGPPLIQWIIYLLNNVFAGE